MKTNYHTHTARCMHATGSDEDYVLSAIKGGYQELGFSDHTPWKYHTDYVADMRMLPEELPGYVESLHSLREKYRDQISIKIGLECEYFPAYIHWLKEKIKEYQLDYILFGNHHYHTDEKFPYFGHHTENLDMLELYEESAIEGMESGLFCCLAHPDLFMRSYPQFDRHCKLISRHICRTAARLHIPLEYNIGYVAYNEAHNLLKSVSTRSVEGTAFYIYNYEQSAYVIVSGDDRMKPVLGYSDNGSFITENLPVNILGWLELYNAAYAELGNGEKAVTEPKLLTKTSFPASVSPLLGSICWDQSAPYNNI